MFQTLEAVFFDLDGTLADTAKDLSRAVNFVLMHHGLKPQPLEFIRPLISGGTAEIIRRCFSIHPSHPFYSLYLHEVLQSYQQILAQETTYFPGILEVLAFLKNKNLSWGIITSKPYWLAKPLLDKLDPDQTYRCLIGRENLYHKKPDPEPLYYACHLTRVSPRHCIYVGDAKTDIIAAQKARMMSVAAAYGYINQDDSPSSWGADHIIHSAYELLTLVERFK